MTDEAEDRVMAETVNRALAARRPPTSRELERRLVAAVARPRRPWLVPMALASAVVVAAAAVTATVRSSDDDEPRALRSVLAAPAGGGVTITVAASSDATDVSVEQEHDEPLEVRVEPSTHPVTIRRRPAPHRAAAPPSLPPVAAVDAPGHIDVDATAPADVYLDGEKVGVTPLEFAATPGVHDVRVAVDEHSYRYRVTVESGQRTRLRVTTPSAPDAPPPPPVPPVPPAAPPAPVAPVAPVAPPAPDAQARLMVMSQPWSEVTIDGRRAGATPLLIEIAPGEYTLTLASPGKRTRTMRVRAEAGMAHKISVSLD